MDSVGFGVFKTSATVGGISPSGYIYVNMTRGSQAGLSSGRMQSMYMAQRVFAMNILFQKSIKLNTGPQYEQEIKRIYIGYYGSGDLNPDESMLFTYPPVKNVSQLPNLNMGQLIAMSNTSFNGFHKDWFTDQYNKNQEEMIVISQPIVNMKTNKTVGFIGLQFSSEDLLKSIVNGNIHRTEGKTTIDFNFHQIVIYDMKSYNNMT